MVPESESEPSEYDESEEKMSLRLARRGDVLARLRFLGALGCALLRFGGASRERGVFPLGTRLETCSSLVFSLKRLGDGVAIWFLALMRDEVRMVGAAF